MQRLAREHLLQIMPRKGCVLSDCRFGDELNVIQVRRPLELVVVRRAATRATPDQRRRFAEIADRMAAALEQDNFRATGCRIQPALPFRMSKRHSDIHDAPDQHAELPLLVHASRPEAAPRRRRKPC
jgi:DNA-binding GntR family transcriptional regulator